MATFGFSSLIQVSPGLVKVTIVFNFLFCSSFITELIFTLYPVVSFVSVAAITTLFFEKSTLGKFNLDLSERSSEITLSNSS